MVSLQRSIDYLTEDDELLEKMLIGIVLMFASFLVIPVFVLYGYVYRIYRETINESQTMPEFDAWTEMFFDGLKIFAASLVYMLVPLFLFVVGFIITESFLVFGIGSLLLFVIGFIFPMSLMNMAANDSLASAFQIGEILNKAFTGDYVIAYLMITVLSAFVGFLGFILIFIPILGQILYFALTFPFMVFSANLIAQAYPR